MTSNITNLKFDSNEIYEDKINAIDQNNRPSELQNLSNHIITSPTNTNSNAVRNTDNSWTDREFDPLEEATSGKIYFGEKMDLKRESRIKLEHEIFISTSFINLI